VGNASVRYAGCVNTPPVLVPVTARTRFPPGPEPESETFKVEVPVPEIEAGSKLAVTPAGAPRIRSQIDGPLNHFRRELNVLVTPAERAGW